MVSTRFSWIGIASLTATAACGLFGEYTTQPGAGGSGLGGSGSGAGGASAGGASLGGGGNGASGTGGGGAGTGCPDLVCVSNCSHENCDTLEGESSFGNRACGERNTQNAGSAPSYTRDTSLFRIAGIAPNQATLAFVGTKPHGSVSTIFLQEPGLKADPSANATMEFAPPIGSLAATGFVGPTPGDSLGTKSFVLGTSQPGFPSDMREVAGAQELVVPLVFTSTQNALPFTARATESRFLTGTLSANQNSSGNTILNVLAVHRSDFGANTTPEEYSNSEVGLSMLRFGETPAFPAVARIQAPTCQDLSLFDRSLRHPASVDAPLYEQNAYFGIGFCNHLLVGRFTGSPGTIQPWGPTNTGAHTDVTVAGVKALESDKLLVVGTFQGDLDLGDGFTAVSTHFEPDPDAHDVFFAMYNRNTSAPLALVGFGGGGDVQINSVAVSHSQGSLYSVYVGGWLSGDVSWGCINANYTGTNRRAFLARVDLLDPTLTDGGPVLPLWVQVYGTDGVDSQVTSVLPLGGEVVLTGEVDPGGQIDQFPHAPVVDELYPVGDLTSGVTFAMRVQSAGVLVTP